MWGGNAGAEPHFLTPSASAQTLSKPAVLIIHPNRRGAQEAPESRDCSESGHSCSPHPSGSSRRPSAGRGKRSPGEEHAAPGTKWASSHKGSKARCWVLPLVLSYTNFRQPPEEPNPRGTPWPRTRAGHHGPWTFLSGQITRFIFVCLLLLFCLVFLRQGLTV